jgi:ribonuclease HI
MHQMRTLHQGMPGGSPGVCGRRCVPVPDGKCLDPSGPCPGSEVDVGTSVIIKMPRPACTIDRPDGNDPVQPLCHGVPEFFKEMSVKNMITIYFDGLCRPKNPGGVATYGYLIYQDGKKVKSGYGVIGSGAGMTNNVAEYSALKQAAEWLIRYGGDDEVVIKGDSQLVIHQMNGTWQVKSGTSKKYVPEIRRLLEGRKTRFVWIPREQNVDADELSNLAYSLQKT